MRVKVISEKDGRTVLAATIGKLDAYRLERLADALGAAAAVLLDDDEAATIEFS